MGGIIKRRIPVISGLVGILGDKVSISDIVDALSSNLTNAPLSANQGRVLEDKKAEKIDVINALDSTDATKIFSASAGSMLSMVATGKLDKDAVSSVLTGNETEEALSADAGRYLNSLLDGRQDGMTYGGVLYPTQGGIPRIDEPGTIYVIAETGKFALASDEQWENDVSLGTLYAGDMIISNGQTYIIDPADPDDEGSQDTYILKASAWDIVDSSETPDILRLSMIATSLKDGSLLPNSEAVVNAVSNLNKSIKDVYPELCVDEDRVIRNNTITTDYEIADNAIVGNMVTIFNGDGTYEEFDGGVVTNASKGKVTLVGASGLFDGKEAKVSYLGKNIESAETMGALVPLYSYPNWYDGDASYVWKPFIDAVKANPGLEVIAILNENNGTVTSGGSDDYKHGMGDLKEAGVTMIGYVPTDFGNANIDDVKALIDGWHTEYKANGIAGIFFDEVGDTLATLPYYTELVAYAKSKAGFTKAVINPGTNIPIEIVEDSGADIIVSYENAQSEYDTNAPTWNEPRAGVKLAMMIHSGTESDMASILATARDNNIRYFYFTDDADSDPWNTIPAFIGTELASL